MSDKQILIEKKAKSYLGIPYKYGVKHEDVPNFLDCSYFTMLVFEDIKKLGRSTILQATEGDEVLNEDYQKGDLLFLRGSKGHYNDDLFPGRNICIGHVVIYLDNGLVIHASSPEGTVIQPLHEVIKNRGPVVIAKRMI